METCHQLLPVSLTKTKKEAKTIAAHVSDSMEVPSIFSFIDFFLEFRIDSGFCFATRTIKSILRLFLFNDFQCAILNSFQIDIKNGLIIVYIGIYI